MRRLALLALVAVAVGGMSVGTATAASPVFRLSILHTLHGCHVWMTTRVLGSSTKVTIKAGTRIVIRPMCPMDFDFAQTAGPRVALGSPRTLRGTTRTIVFPRRGVYRFTARNVQTPAEVGLQTLGPDNILSLTVVVG